MITVAMLVSASFRFVVCVALLRRREQIDGYRSFWFVVAGKHLDDRSK
jgi:hypothetical protein